MTIGATRVGLRFGTGGSRVPVVVYPDPEALGRALAGEILAGAARARGAGRAYLLGCPAGRSLRSTYLALARLLRRPESDSEERNERTSFENQDNLHHRPFMPTSRDNRRDDSEY